MTLYELSVEELELLNSIDDESVAEEEIINKFIKNTEEKEKKYASYIKIIENLESDKEQLKNHVTNTQEKLKRIDNQILRLKNYILKAMEITKDKKIKTPLGTVNYSEGRASCLIKNENLIPSEFKIVEEVVKIDKKKILELYKNNGEVIDGTEIEYKPFITIR